MRDRTGHPLAPGDLVTIFQDGLVVGVGRVLREFNLPYGEEPTAAWVRVLDGETDDLRPEGYVRYGLCQRTDPATATAWLMGVRT